MLKYINALVPLVIGIIILAFPQFFTKKDLNAKENKSTKTTIIVIGIIAIVISVLVFLKGTNLK